MDSGNPNNFTQESRDAYDFDMRRIQERNEAEALARIVMENKSLRARLAAVEAERDASMRYASEWQIKYQALRNQDSTAEAREKAKDERIADMERIIEAWPCECSSASPVECSICAIRAAIAPSQPVKVAEEKPCQNCGQEKGRHEAGTFFCDNDTNGMMRYVPPAEKPQQEKL